MSSLQLGPGKFYRSREGYIWCCFRIDTSKAEHCQADCILTSMGSWRIEYFFLDGRYDVGGKREHCLVEEVPPGTLCKEDAAKCKWCYDTGRRISYAYNSNVCNHCNVRA